MNALQTFSPSNDITFAELCRKQRTKPNMTICAEMENGRGKKEVRQEKKDLFSAVENH